MNNSLVPGLEYLNAIFDTGSAMMIGDQASVTAFFAPLESSSGAQPMTSSPGYYTSAWANFAADQPSQQYLIFIYLFSPMRLRYSNLRLGWREGSQNLP